MYENLRIVIEDHVPLQKAKGVSAYPPLKGKDDSLNFDKGKQIRQTDKNSL